ncbi:MFS transporter [Loigolactobacillus backii]|uniref:MFS transporter n=1 Tax=Loigolactobacillus backii TaxID=375175 RepID=UPI001EE7095D|nr:MFS transporter [Loigolactobacillus backii]
MIMTAIFVATFMTSVETTIVTTALPTIISKLNGLSLQSWVFAMYLLTTAVSTPIYGKLADRSGRKQIFISGLIVFSVGSFLCGISINIYELILFRAVQGIGSGAIMPITFTIIADLFTYEKRSTMLALNNTAWGISALLGPLIGGFIVDQLNWHWIFFINVPLGVVVLILVIFGFKEQPRKSEKRPIDFKGIFSLSGSLVFLLLLFQILGNQRVKLSVIGAMAAFFLTFLYLFCRAEKDAQDPIIPLTLFKNQLFTIQIATALLLSGIQIGFQTYFPIWLQSIYKVSASVAGLAVTPSPVLWLISSFFVGALVRRFAPKRITGPIILIQLLFYVPLVIAGVKFPMPLFYIIAGVTGAGLGIIITMNTLISQRVVPGNNVGTASSMLTLGRTLGQTIMTGVFGLIFNLSINRSLMTHQNVNLVQVNKFISSTQKNNVSSNSVITMENIIVGGMHHIFAAVLILFVLILLLNISDKNKYAIN